MLAANQISYTHVITVVIPDCEDPYWETVAPPLHQAISTANGLTIKEILKWGIRQGITQNLVRQMLAWLSINSLVFFNTSNRMWNVNKEKT
jgi:hypothetical protein